MLGQFAGVSVFFFVGLILLLGMLGYVVATGARPDRRVRSAGLTFLGPYLAEQRRIATRVGLPFRVWVGMRVAIVVGLFLVGLHSQIVLLMIGGMLGGYFGFPWIFHQRAAVRQEELNRAVLATAREMVKRMDTGRAFDVVARDVAANPRAEVEYVLAPLLSEQRIEMSLLQVAARAQSALAEMTFVCMVLGRGRDQSQLQEVIRDTIVPTQSKAVEMEDMDLAAKQERRAVVYVMLGIAAVFVYVLQAIPGFAQIYGTLMGQLWLLGCAAMFGGSVYFMDLLAPKVQWTRWDLDLVRRQFVEGEQARGF